ncbi:HPF/RaiA family ribosome-associated protein [Candidatus Peregrinibacteria bacterium]|nr:HPF/RaiA family ribosome-associated protein [Candidatus Peregrinibacteria bacterium]
MEVRIFTKEMSPSEVKKVKDYSSTKIEPIERLLGHFAADAIRLDINAEKLGRRSAYRVEFVLHLPSKTIIGREASHEITKAVDLAKDRVVRQIKKHEELLRDRKTYTEKPHQQAGDIDYHKLTALTKIKQEQRDRLIDIIQPHLEKLNKFIKREILLKESGDIIPENEIESESILNEVILEFYENYNPSLRGKDLEQWLYMVAINKIRSSIDTLKDEGLKMVPIEDGEGEKPRVDEDFEYSEPIEIKSMMTEIPSNDEEIIPEKIAKKKELSRFLMDELSKIPDRKREAFVLHKLEGFLLAQISEIQHRPLKAVKSDVEEVQRVLAEKAQQEFGEEM